LRPGMAPHWPWKPIGAQAHTALLPYPDVLPMEREPATCGLLVAAGTGYIREPLCQDLHC
jgi:hypothetical protein